MKNYTRQTLFIFRHLLFNAHQLWEGSSLVIILLAASFLPLTAQTVDERWLFVTRNVGGDQHILIDKQNLLKDYSAAKPTVIV